jgi:hypothetical protein
VSPAFDAPVNESDRIAEPFPPAATVSPEWLWKFTCTTGFPLNPGAVAPSIVSGPVIAGKAVLPTKIWPAWVNWIVSSPDAALASRIAWRSEPGPDAASVLTVNVASTRRRSSGSIAIPREAARRPFTKTRPRRRADAVVFRKGQIM